MFKSAPSLPVFSAFALSSRFLLSALSLTLLSAGCETRDRSHEDSAALDAGTSLDATAVLDGTRTDTGPGDDAGPPPDTGLADTSPPPARGEILDFCASDSECIEGLHCSNDWPGRFCTQACSTEVGCGPEALCLDGLCAPPCRSGARDCDPFGGSCLGGVICVPACGAAEGVAFDCDAPLICDSAIGFCGTSISSTGAPVGGPCEAHADCRSGVCFAEVGESGPTGFVGGYCVAATRYGGPSSDGSLVQGGCPDGSAIFDSGDVLVGDDVTCLRTCLDEDECRDGYACRGPAGFRRRFCVPAGCDLAGDIACPAGTSCEAATGRNVCAPCSPVCDGRACGSDGCGGRCGMCTGDTRCNGAGTCECVPETDSGLCAAAGAECGALSVVDRCGVPRMITSCGSCLGTDSCGAASANRCDCIAETDAELCARSSATCGSLTARDACGATRTVDCGTCTAPEVCGGAGVSNVCGVCTPSCAGRTCGSDGCGGSCGSCRTGESCESGACRVVPCDPVDNTLCSASTKCIWNGSRTECATAGTGRAGAGCGSSSNCAPEHTCTSEGFCREYCQTSSDCTRGACAYDLTGSPYGLCSRSCNPDSAAGATGCSPGEGCRLFNSARATEVTDCGRYGLRGEGSSCGSTEECTTGHTCAGGSCMRVCTLGSSCATGTCGRVTGWSRYGVCP